MDDEASNGAFWEERFAKKKKDELEEFLERIREGKYEREDVQKKTFGKWINSMLARGSHPPISDMFSDLRDGTKLLALLEVLTNKQYKRERGKMRVHHLNNVSRALDVLKEQGVRLVNISNNEIVDGSAKITLALSWTIFLHWQVNDIMKDLMATMKQSNLEKALLCWCQMNSAPYPGVEIKNFSTSWSDGLAFAAILHRWRPDIIDFATVVSKTDPNERLEMAFKAAQEALGIDRLLDPEDVNTAVPDKKSVMMYVMCLFQALARSGIEPPPLPTKASLNDAIDAAKKEEEAREEKARGPSVELTSYQGIVEEVLSWLLIADDRVNTMENISDGLDEVKGQFQEHEKFMLSLTDHQGDVGEVLQEGSRLLQEAKLPPGEIEEVRSQMKLLNTKWEDLRVKAMDRQNRIHEKLMALQLAELEALKEFLTGTENRISLMSSPLIHDTSLLEKQLEEQQILHEDILKEQQRVVSFSNLVVVVDENNPDTSEYANIEDQLAGLSERWSHICSWTEKRGKVLMKLIGEVPEHLERLKDLEQWLHSQERKLKEVEANPNENSEESLMERYEKLQSLQSEMENKMHEIEELQNTLQKISDESAKEVGETPNPVPPEGESDVKSPRMEDGNKVMEKLELLQDRWDALSQILEAQSQRITKYGVVKSDPKKSKLRTGSDVEMFDIVGLARAPQEDFPKAKRTKIMNEWETNYSRVNEWILRTESLVDTSPGSMCTFDELSVDEQLILWEDLETERAGNVEVYEQGLKDSKELIKILKLDSQDPSEIEKQSEEMELKWDKVKTLMANRKQLIDYLLVKKQLASELRSLSNIIGTYEKWLDSHKKKVSPISSEGRRLLEQCRVKKKTLLSHEDRVNKFKGKVKDAFEKHEENAATDLELKEGVEAFFTKWELTGERLKDKLNELEDINEMTNEERTTEASQIILQWINATEGYLLQEEVKLTDLTAMKQHQLKLEEYVKAASAHDRHITKIENSNQSVCPEAGSIEELKSRYIEVKALLEERSEQLKSLIDKVSTWQEEVTGLESWLEEVDVFVCAETPAIGDSETLEAQLEQSNALQKDVSTLSPKFTSLNKTGQTLIKEADEPTMPILKTRLLKLTSHWNETTRKAKDQNQLLKNSYDKTKGVLDGVNSISTWLDSLEKDSPSIGPISSPSDLARLSRKYQALKDRVDKKEDIFRVLNDRGNELLLIHQNHCKDDTRRSSTVQELARTFTLLNSRWTEVTGNVDRNFKLLKEASYLYGEFRSLSAQENDWLDRLEKKLKKPVTSAADVEEISEDLDDIEYMGNQQELQLAKLQDISRQMMEKGILSNFISSDLNQVTNRQQKLKGQASERKQLLESEMTEAERWEDDIQQLESEIASLDKLLSARLEHELTPDDIDNVDDAKQLSEELGKQEKLLESMALQVEKYQKAGKLEAAARLEEQRDLLKTRFSSVRSKFDQFSFPPPESKLLGRIERIWRSLRQIEQKLCFLELSSDDPESIQSQLNQCSKEYTTLSDLKKEVELVLREGRRQVEDKKADNKLNTELDGMKALYNKLGMQIASIRGTLEKGLTVSSQLQDQMGSLEFWLQESEMRMEEGFKDDKKEEVEFLRAHVEELPRWTQIIQEFEKNYNHFLKLVDPILLDSLKERRALILQKWDFLSKDIVNNHKESISPTKIPELEQSHEKGVQDLKDWLEKADKFLNRATIENVMFSDEEIMELQALDEDLTERTDKLDSLRDQSIDLIVAKGDPFSVSNPENLVIQELSRRLESIGHQLQNLSSCIVIDEESLEDTPIASTANSVTKTGFTSSADVNNVTPVGQRYSQQPEEYSGISNPAFFDDEEEDEIERELEQVVEQRKSFEVISPVSKSKSERPSEDTDEDVGSLSVSEASTIIPSGETLRPVLQEAKKQNGSAAAVVSPPRQGEIMKKRASIKERPSKRPEEGNVKIVEIKSQDVVQGILRMEPHLGMKDHVSIVKVPVSQRSTRSSVNAKRASVKYGGGASAASSSGSGPMSQDKSRDPVNKKKVATTSEPSEKPIIVEPSAFALIAKTFTNPDSNEDQVKDPDLLLFQKESLTVSQTMARMSTKLQEIEKDSDLRKRIDLIEEELSSVEPEVALTISKGDSLVFKMAKVDVDKAKLIRSALDLLRGDWGRLKGRAESQKFTALRLETTQLECQSVLQELDDWISEAKQNVDSEAFHTEYPTKLREYNNLKKKIMELNRRNVKTLLEDMDNLEKNWSELEDIIQKPKEITKEQREDSCPPIVKPKPISLNKKDIGTNSSDFVIKVNKLREQIATITRAVGSSEDLLKVKEDLDSISPKVLEFEEQFESGGMRGTPEQVSQSRRVLQKMLDEWSTLSITVGQLLLRLPSKSPSPVPSPVSQTSDIMELESWLDEIEEKLKLLKNNRDDQESKENLKMIESQVTKRHRSVMLLMSKKSRLSPAYDDSTKKIENIGTRWRNVLAEMTMRRDRICGDSGVLKITGGKWWEPHVVLRDWIRRANEAIDTEVRIADESALRNSLSNLKILEHEIIGKRPDLEKLRQSKHNYVTEDEIKGFKGDIDRLIDELPRLRKLVELKLTNLRKLTSHLDTTGSWVLELRAQVATAKHRPIEERERAIESILLRMEHKETQVMDVIRNYINLEKECETNNQSMTPVMKEKIRQLKEDWVYIKSRGEINVLSPAVEGKYFDIVRESFVGEAYEKVVTKAEVAHHPYHHNLPQESTDNLSSSLVQKDLEEERNLHFNLDAEGLKVLKELKTFDDSMTLNLKSIKQQTVVVGDVDHVRNILEKQRTVLRELELKKPQLDELLQTAENLKSETNRHNLHGKVNKLKEHWVETNHAVINRIALLEQCLGDSIQWECQWKEVDAWLSHMESRVPVVFNTNGQSGGDDTFMKEQKNLHVELHQYKKHVESFQHMTSQMAATYQQDDTSRVKRALEQVNVRYAHLNNSAVLVGRALHVAQSTLTTIDRQLADKISWITDCERSLEVLEADAHRFGSSGGQKDPNGLRTCMQRVKELQCELETHAATIAALGGSARTAAAGLDRQEEDATALLHRLDEMNQRWHGLKQRSMAIRSRLENNTDHWHALLLSLRELIEWAIRKDTELTALGPLAGDVVSLQKQMDDHRSFRRQLEAKRPIIETNLISGRQHVANEPPVSDASDSEARQQDSDLRGYRSAESAARELTRSIRRDVTKLSEIWISLLNRSDNWQGRLEEGITHLQSFQLSLDDASARLATAEAIKSRWLTIAAAADKPNLLDQLKTFREHISSTQRAVNEINEHAGILTASNFVLSNVNISRIDDLNSRLRNLQQNCEEKESELRGVNSQGQGQGGLGTEALIQSNGNSGQSSVSPPWERALTGNKVPYYVNHQTETTQWDHPRMAELLNSLAEYNEVRFSAYRTALKLRSVQRELRLEKLPLKTVIETFDSLGLRGYNDRLLDVPDMISTLSTLYNVCLKQSQPQGKHVVSEPPPPTPYLTDMSINWLLAVYDCQRTGQIRNLSFKVGVVLLSRGSMEDKFKFLFRLVADVSKQVDQRKLGLLLHDCIQIPRQLGEVAAFGGSNIEPSVRSCFEKAGKEKMAIEAAHFLEWVKQEPQSLVWLPVLHRIAAAESVRHGARCNVCKSFPIMGLRYRCLKCFNFDMCQKCFFAGKKAKSHKLTHPMQEYCTETTSGEDVRDFTKALKNRFKSKRSLQKHRKLGYLPVQSVLEGDMLESPAPSPQHSLSPDIHSRVDTYAARLAEVELRNTNRSNSTPESEDEHSLIAQYCHTLSSTRSTNILGDSTIIPRSPIQIVAAIDAEQSEQLEAVIRALEEENASLQAEYERLRVKSQSSGHVLTPDIENSNGNLNGSSKPHTDSNENNILAEARLLRQHKTRLESRMQILEDHNRQLEAQLQRLRQLLNEPKPSSPSKTGTLQSKSVVAAELAMDSPVMQRGSRVNNGHSASAVEAPVQWQSPLSYPDDRPPPPTPGYAANASANVDELLSRTSEIGRAVGELVQAMTDDEHEDSPDYGRRPSYERPNN